MHALLECSRAREAWKASDFAHFYLQNNHLDIIHFLSNVFSSLDKGSADLLMCFMWTIWNQRNNQFFNRFTLDPKDMFACCQSFLLQYLDAGLKRFIPSSQGDQSPSVMDWCPPGKYQVFTDAAIDTGKQVFSLSVVVKNDTDQVIAGLVKPVAGLIAPVIAEAKAVSLAVAWTKMINLPVHVLFLDCKVVVDKINKCNWNNSVCDDVLIDVYNSLSFNPRPKVVFIRRDDNTHAHNLAKLGLGLDRQLLWNGSLPSL
uniref:RNase H type-1 domain-containing protein n=2 Tax=Cannabis sativa TaxID=3483 RepID=A0A803P9W0_CANSA